MKAKRFVSLASALAMLLISSGCSSGQDASSSGGGTNSSSKAKTIKFASFQTDTIAEDWETVQFPAYEEETGVKVEHVFVNHTDTLSTYMTWAASDSLPDAAMLSADYLNSLVTKGMILNLSDYTEANGIDYDFDRYFPNLLNAYKYEGDVYALPSDMDINMLYYNKDIFDEAGVAYPTNDWTWEDLRENAKALTSGEGPNKIYGVNWGNYIPFLWQNETNTISEDGTECLLNTPAAIETFDFLASMLHEDESAVMPGTDEPMFDNGKCAMTYSGPWYAYYNLAEVDFEWGIAAVPAGKVKATSCYGSTFAVFEASPNQKEAVDFLTWFLSDEQQLDRAEKFCWFPPASSVVEAGNFMDDDSIMGLTKEQKELIMSETECGDAPIVVENQNEINQILDRELTLLWAGEKSVEDALNTAAEEIAPLL